MDHFSQIVVSNALIATTLAIGVALLGRVWKNLAAIHLLWVLVLIKFFTPPIVTAPLPFAASCKSLPAYACIAGGYTTQIASNEHAAPTAPISSDASFVEHPATSIEQRLTPNESSITGTRTVWLLSLALTAIWCAGSACIAIGYAFRICRFARWLRETDHPSDEIYAAVERIAAKLGLRRAPEVVMTSRAVPPLVWCAGSRPRLVLPAELFERLSETARTTILAHELTHIRRGDYLVRLLELAAKTVFWWHPVVWWACAQLHDLEEQCCDAGVLELVPNQVRTYASALVDTLEFLSGQTRVVVPLPTAIYSAGSLSRRIRMLAQDRSSQLGVRSLVVVAMLAAAPLAITFGAEAPDGKKDAPKSSNSAVAAAVLSGRVTNEIGEPLAGARVRVAIPAIDMRFVDDEEKHKTLEAKADAMGNYRIEIPGIAKRTNISVDVMQPGYRKLAGTLMSGGDVTHVSLAPVSVTTASFTLKPSLYLKGVVVDEQGKPLSGIAIGSNAEWKKKSGGVERTVSNRDGSFELFNFPLEPPTDRDGNAKGVVRFAHKDYLSNTIDDVYALDPRERQSLRVVLGTGNAITGKVIGADGKPVAGVMVVAALENGEGRKAMTTEADGSFKLRGLMKGETKLRAHALNLKQKIELPINLAGDMRDVELRLKPITLGAQPRPVTVLGMQLTDNSPELKEVYDRHDARGALILDPGKDSERLQIGDLAEGYTFWMAGDERINNVREFIKGILAEAAKQSGDEYSVRVVYSFETLAFAGTNTQYMKLSKKDIEELKTVLARLEK